MKNKTEMIEVLKQHIVDKFYSQSNFAKEWAISRQYVHQLLTGDRPIPGYILESLGYELVTYSRYRKIKK
jgi:hypothetical protein